MTDLAIDVRGLRKRYGDLEAVKGVNLQVARAEVFALLGPNGAGKTTAVEILEGHRERDGGEVRVLGFDPGRRERAFKERIGVVLQETGVEPYLTVEETVELYRGYYPHPRPLDEVIDLVGLTEQRRTRVIKLSGGQQRRLDVAVGLAGDPELLFLDEPTTGFDPAARRDAWEMIKGLQALGKTIFLTTHYMDEAEILAGRVAIIRRGEIVALGSPRDLIDTEARTLIRFRIPPGAAGLVDGIEGADVQPDAYVTIATVDPTGILHLLTGRAIDRGVELGELQVARASLEDVYLRYVGEDPAQESAEAAPSRGSRRRGRS
ncbi:MAG: ATP-binding cassette domain-containing protein [Dehalococcoidia bacterium]|nr:ATP-binding cassette domain-containing protein [Dehalococcoidia bacterium]